MAGHPLAIDVKRRDKILAALRPFGRIPLDGLSVGRAVEDLLKVLPKGVPYSAVFRSINSLIGSVADPQVLKDVAWSMAVNVKQLKKNEVVWPPAIPTHPTTVSLQVLAAKRLPMRVKAQGQGFPIKYRMKIVSGPGSPLTVDTRFSSRFVSYLACRPQGFGFSRPPRGNRPATGRPYQHYSTLVGMLLKADISVDSEGKTKIENFRCTPSFIEYNRALIEMRWRSTFDCPFGFAHPCHQCSKGQESCKVATHPKDHKIKMCPQCMENEEFDAYWVEPVCMKCSLKPRKE